MSFEVDTRDLTHAAAALDGFDELADHVAEPLLDSAGDVALDTVRSRAARHRRTGRMLGQIRLQRQGDGVRHEVRVRAGGPMASLIVTGSSAHDIKPVRARALALGGPVRQPFAARVHHPGTRSDPFVAAGFDDAVGDVDREATRALDRLTDQLADSMTRR